MYVRNSNRVNGVRVLYAGIADYNLYIIIIVIIIHFGFTVQLDSIWLRCYYSLVLVWMHLLIKLVTVVALTCFAHAHVYMCCV